MSFPLCNRLCCDSKRCLLVQFGLQDLKRDFFDDRKLVLSLAPTHSVSVKRRFTQVTKVVVIGAHVFVGRKFEVVVVVEPCELQHVSKALDCAFMFAEQSVEVAKLLVHVGLVLELVLLLAKGLELFKHANCGLEVFEVDADVALCFQGPKMQRKVLEVVEEEVDDCVVYAHDGEELEFPDLLRVRYLLLDLRPFVWLWLTCL